MCSFTVTVDFVVSEDTSLAVTHLDSDTVSLSVLNVTLLHRQPSAGFNLCIFRVFSTYMTNSCSLQDLIILGKKREF